MSEFFLIKKYPDADPFVTCILELATERDAFDGDIKGENSRGTPKQILKEKSVFKQRLGIKGCSATIKSAQQIGA